MTTFSTFSNRLAFRLSSFRDAARVREAAQGIAATIENECEICNAAGYNGAGLHFLAMMGHKKIPTTRKAQAAFIEAAIQRLNEHQ